jgi:ribosomal protein L3 glutamine methyltransferase
MEELYPGAPFEWIEFEQGGLGVFVISKQQLVNYFED